MDMEMQMQMQMQRWCKSALHTIVLDTKYLG